MRKEKFLIHAPGTAQRVGEARNPENTSGLNLKRAPLKGSPGIGHRLRKGIAARCRPSLPPACPASRRLAAVRILARPAGLLL